MANPQSPLQQYVRIPDVTGAVRCHKNSDVIEQSGPAAESFGNVLMYLRQSATLVGEAFGLEDFHEMHVQAKDLTALCLARGDETLGLLTTPGARPAAIVANIATIRSGT